MRLPGFHPDDARQGVLPWLDVMAAGGRRAAPVRPHEREGVQFTR